LRLNIRQLANPPEKFNNREGEFYPTPLFLSSQRSISNHCSGHSEF
jgi:hypothetical protein